MSISPRKNSERSDAPEDGPASLFDSVASVEADLWFMPDRIAPEPAHRPPPRLLFDPAVWRQAQADLSGELAGLALNFGTLDERLRLLGDGARQRLALREAADLSWWAGDRIGVEALSLWLGQRAGSQGDDGPALALAGWAARRLAGGQRPANPDWAAGIARCLDHGRRGEHAATAAEEVAEVMATLPGLHPVTEAAVLFQAWRLAGPGHGRDAEAAVLAATHAGSIGRGSAPFLPLAGAGAAALLASGPPRARLAAWIRGADQAVLAALLQLERLTAWRQRAESALADLSGRTPQRLLALIADWPLVSAALAEAQTGASRAAVQRNLDLMLQRQLIREVTGQGRYRLWAARL